MPKFDKYRCRHRKEDGQTTAIDLNPNYAMDYYYCGETWLHLGEWEKARLDLRVAKSMGVDIIAVFHYFSESIEAYKRANRVKLPEDIASMLTS
ncbi:hypothetical protein J4G02_18580 [Candidatus Poribacteria bacterium]|nr:hypothetical protein [Candidatus Poribacteria bacterium]